MRLAASGATCTKIESPALDPMQQYSETAYAQMHQGIRTVLINLKTSAGQKALARHLAKADLVLTSFRPAALTKLGLAWPDLHRQYPQLSQIAVVGHAGARANEPGHDLTYMADNGLITGLQTPATLFADMAGALMVVEAAFKAVLAQRANGEGAYFEVALADAAAFLALPRQWGLTKPSGAVGGAHAGYRLYACKNGRVAVAALEPHFAQRLCAAAGLPEGAARRIRSPGTHRALEAFFATQSRAQVEQLARVHDLPLHTLGAG